MDKLQILALVLFAVGVVIYFEMSPLKIMEEAIAAFSKKRVTLKRIVKKDKNKGRDRDLVTMIVSAKNTLTITGKGDQFPIYCLISAAGFVFGIFVGGLLDNQFATPVLAVGFAVAPFTIIRVLSYSYKKELNRELETTLSIITTSYLRQESFYKAVKENINYLQGNMKDIFSAFIYDIEDLNVNIIRAIDDMSQKIDNDTWHEWCDNVALCQGNRDLRSILPPIINKFSDVRSVTEDLSYALYGPVKELAVMCLILLGTIPGMYALNNAWFAALMYSTPGKIVLALDFMVIFIVLNAGVKHSKPVEYKR